MNITGCVPLAGQGIITRRGSLIALTDGTDPGPDPLLAAVAAVADGGGDGAALALAGTRAALERVATERVGQPAWACAGVTSAGEVAVLVYGEAVALVLADGGPEEEVIARGSMIPVVRTFAGAAITVQLAIGAPGAPDPRLWLGAGAVYGGGVLLTVSREESQAFPPNDPDPSAAFSPLPGLDAGTGTVRRHPGPAPAEPVLADHVQPAFVPVAPVPADVPHESGHEPTMLAGRATGDAPPPPETVLSGAVPAGAVPAGGFPAEAFDPGYVPTVLAGAARSPAQAPADEPAWPGEQAAFPDDPFAHQPGPAQAGPAEPAQGAPASESWFRADAQVPRPTSQMRQADANGASPMGEPPVADLSTMELVRLEAVEPVLVDGAMCARGHFNAPEAMYCRECGMGMHEASRPVLRQPRPPLGILLVDDGRGFTLDRDYVIGREPVLDGDVAAGRATPLRIADPKGTVSRLHLRVSLIGWQVEVRDLGSANGSVLHNQGGQHRLAPLDAAILDPGARVGVGRRTVQFVPYGASPFAPYGGSS
jgi:hypothetical protein